MGGYWDAEGAVELLLEPAVVVLLLGAAVFLAELPQAATTIAAQTDTTTSLGLLRTLHTPVSVITNMRHGTEVAR